MIYFPYFHSNQMNYKLFRWPFQKTRTCLLFGINYNFSAWLNFGQKCFFFKSSINNKAKWKKSKSLTFDKAKVELALSFSLKFFQPGKFVLNYMIDSKLVSIFKNSHFLQSKHCIVVNKLSIVNDLL